ncbi:MAG: TIM44-like domain-containing protein [Candidatus Riflebacteria bacterium]
MRITKQQFLLFIAGMFVLAGLFTWWIGIDTVFDRSQPVEIFYLAGASIIVFYLGHLGLVVPAVAVSYGASLFFCFFYFFIAPFEAPLVLAMFFVPAILWQRREVGCLPVIISGIGLILLCWKVLDRPVIPILLIPTCHLIAIRMTTQVYSRYNKEATDIGGYLTQRQKQRRGEIADTGKDWWDYLQPELEALPKKIAESWGEMLGEEPRRHMGQESVLDRSLLHLQNAGMMSKALTDIRRRDPDFASEDFIKRVDKVFWKVQNAWYSQNLDQIQHMVSDALFEQFRCQVEEQKAAGIRYQYQDMTIYETRIAQVNTDANFDAIHVFIRASSADALFDLDTKEELARNEDRRKFCEYWTFIRRPSAKTLKKAGLLEDNCPNCGAPIEIGQATVCKVCNSFIRSGSYDWVLAKITQACEWDYYECSLLDGWEKMVASDSNFNIQQIEDRGGVVFWMQRLAERQKKIDPIRRFATEALCESYFGEKGGSAVPLGSYVENVALAIVKLQGFKLSTFWDRIFVLVVWSGVPVIFAQSGKIVEQKRVSQVRRDVMVMIRRHGSQTDLKNTLTSAHCHNCGGPLSSSFTVQCGYCNSILNEGTGSWILERITSEGDPEYIKILESKSAAKVEDHEDAEIRSARDVITVAAQILLADGKTAIEELKLLEKIAASHHMKQEEVNSIIYGLQNGEVYIPAPANSKESWSLLQSAARMALCDNDLSPEEEKCLDALAQHIGYSQADVRRALKAEVKRRFAAGEKINPKLVQ